jgi:hypothetical protein
MESNAPCSSTLFFATVGLWWIYRKYFNSTPPSPTKAAIASSVEPAVEPLNLPIIDLDLIFQRDSQPEKFQMECNNIAQGNSLP